MSLAYCLYVGEKKIFQNYTMSTSLHHHHHKFHDVLLHKYSINLLLTLHSTNAAVSQSLWVIVQLAAAAVSSRESDCKQHASPPPR